ncbi:MAG: arsenate reductase ArsC [Bryobacterales bacterium]|nr:arsenate reductase ArsC [Bryobacterales bacterium]
MLHAGTGRRRVLFLCTGNSCRSQMAEGLLRHFGQGLFEAFSAGTRPQGLNPAAVQAMREIGIDISGHKSEHVDAYLESGIDTVITVCDHAAANCPVFPGRAERVAWSFEDPAAALGNEGQRMAVFRRVRDEISGSVRSWIDRGPPEG